jgi:transcriptional regulator with XRE-family HTH domain
MPLSPDTLDVRLGARLRAEREGRGWSLTDLAERSGVSRANISRVERGAASPTAALLGRLSGALGLPLSALYAHAEPAGAARLLRAENQERWRDPGTGAVRRRIAPVPGSDHPLNLVGIALAAGASLAEPAAVDAALRPQKRKGSRPDY